MEQASFPGGGFMSLIFLLWQHIREVLYLFEFQLLQAFSTANTCSFHSSKITETMTAIIIQAKLFCVSPQQKRKFCCKYEGFLSLSTEAVICSVEPCFQWNGKNCFFHGVLQRSWLLKYHKHKEFLHNTCVNWIFVL